MEAGTAFASGVGYAALTVSGTSGIYVIDLPTAGATLVASLSATTDDIAVGRSTP